MRRRLDIHESEMKNVDHTPGISEMTPSAPMTRKQQKKQARREAKTMLQLKQSRKDVKKAEQKITRAQAQLETSLTRVQALEAKLEKIRARSTQADQAAQTDQQRATPALQQPVAAHIAAADHITTSTPVDEATSLTLAEADIDALAQQPASDALPKYGLYAYGLVGTHPQHLDMPGIDKHNAVYTVAGHDMFVLVSKIDIDQFQKQVKHLFAELNTNVGAVERGAGAILQAHEDVIDAIMQQTTVVPLKFGTILKDEQAAIKMLQDHEEEFQRLLAKFRDRVECGLKVYADRQAVMKYILQAEPGFVDREEKREPLSRGAAYLLGRKKEEEVKDHVTARLARLTEEIFREFSREAFEARLIDILPQKVTGKKHEMVLNAAYLLGREHVAGVFQQAAQLKEKYRPLGLELEMSGPWPPYNFT